MPSRPLKASKRYRVKTALHKTDAHFPFLELPAELRNRVYEYTLTADEGIKVQWRPGKNRRTKKPVMLVDGSSESDIYPINQLQYVNRELRKETVGLEIQYNRVSFGTERLTRGETQVTSALRFAGTCAPNKQPWLTHVVLEGFAALFKTPEQTDLFDWVNNGMEKSGIFKFCQEFPHVRVDVRLPGLCLTRDNRFEVVSFMLRVVVILKLFRGPDVSHLFSGHDMGVSESLVPRWWFDLYFCAKLRELVDDAPKLRIVPMDKVVDIQAFKAEMVHRRRSITHKFPMFMQRDEDAWALETQRWISDGM